VTTSATPNVTPPLPPGQPLVPAVEGHKSLEENQKLEVDVTRRSEGPAGSERQARGLGWHATCRSAAKSLSTCKESSLECRVRGELRFIDDDGLLRLRVIQGVYHEEETHEPLSQAIAIVRTVVRLELEVVPALGPISMNHVGGGSTTLWSTLLKSSALR
jgi:hypothetical protein